MTRLSPRRFVGIAASVSVAVTGRACSRQLVRQRRSGSLAERWVWRLRGAPRSPAAARDHAGPGDGAAAMRTRGGDRRREQRRARSRRWRRNPRVAGSGGGGTARIECAPGGREADERFPRRPASGGRRQRKRFGHDGFGGAQHRRDQRARVEVALAGGTHDAGQHLLGVGPAPGAVAAADLTRDHCGSDGLFGPPVGGVERVAEYSDSGAYTGQVRWPAARRVPPFPGATC